MLFATGWVRSRYAGFAALYRRAEKTKTQHPAQCRSLFTNVIDPPPNVTERPCTVILAEDSNLGILDPSNVLIGSSWKSVFAEKFPVDYGIPVATWSLSPSSSRKSNLSLDDALSEMKSDFSSSTIAQPILVARGPWIGWLAQFYLESLPLSALILVDPLPFGDSVQACRMYENLHQSNRHAANEPPMPVEYNLFQDYLQHSDHWTLRLEPAAVPTLVLSTIPSWHAHALTTAARHSTGSATTTAAATHGEVPVKILCDKDDIVAEIGQWILQEDIL